MKVKKYISLVNLIAGEEVVKELIQNDLTPENIRKELDSVYKNKQTITSDYENLRSKLGNKGASFRAAQEVMQIFQNS